MVSGDPCKESLNRAGVGSKHSSVKQQRSRDPVCVAVQWTSAGNSLKNQKMDAKGKKRKRDQSLAVPNQLTDNADNAHRDPAAEADFLTTNEIVIQAAKGSAPPPPPCIAIEHAPFARVLINMLHDEMFAQPSPIQAASWPVAATGSDLLAIAETGSGKTLGYLLPTLSVCHLKKEPPSKYPLALVIAPTRELALQIHSEAAKFGRRPPEYRTLYAENNC